MDYYEILLHLTTIDKTENGMKIYFILYILYLFISNNI